MPGLDAAQVRVTFNGQALPGVVGIDFAASRPDRERAAPPGPRPLTPERARALLGRAQLRHPPFPLRLSISEDPCFCWECEARHGLLVTMYVQDRDSGQPRDFTLKKALPGKATDGDFFRFVRAAIHELAAHEIDECLQVDGRRVFDPHVPESFRAPIEERPAAVNIPARPFREDAVVEQRHPAVLRAYLEDRLRAYLSRGSGPFAFPLFAPAADPVEEMRRALAQLPPVPLTIPPELLPAGPHKEAALVLPGEAPPLVIAPPRRAAPVEVPRLDLGEPAPGDVLVSVAPIGDREVPPSQRWRWRAPAAPSLGPPAP